MRWESWGPLAGLIFTATMTIFTTVRTMLRDSRKDREEIDKISDARHLAMETIGQHHTFQLERLTADVSLLKSLLESLVQRQSS